MLLQELRPLFSRPALHSVHWKLEHLAHLGERDVLVYVKLKEAVNLRAIPSHDLQAKHVRLILFHDQSAYVGRPSPLEFVDKAQVVLFFEVINLVLSRLHFLITDESALGIHTVDEALLELDLFVRDLILTSLTIDKGLVHTVLVVEGWHLLCRRSIVVAEELLHLALTSLLACLQLVLELVVDLL